MSYYFKATQRILKIESQILELNFIVGNFTFKGTIIHRIVAKVFEAGLAIVLYLPTQLCLSYGSQNLPQRTKSYSYSYNNGNGYGFIHSESSLTHDLVTVDVMFIYSTGCGGLVVTSTLDTFLLQKYQTYLLRFN